MKQRAECTVTFDQHSSEFAADPWRQLREAREVFPNTVAVPSIFSTSPGWAVSVAGSWAAEGAMVSVMAVASKPATNSVRIYDLLCALQDISAP